MEKNSKENGFSSRADDDNGKDNTWYLIKGGDGMERLSPKKDDSSALSGRSMEQIAKARDAVWHSNRNGAKRIGSRTQESDVDLESLPTGRVKFIEPMLATAVSKLPADQPGMDLPSKAGRLPMSRGQKPSGVKIWSRRGNLLNRNFPGVVRACEALPETLSLTAKSSHWMKTGGARSTCCSITAPKRARFGFYAFDLLVYRGRSTLGLELVKRRDLLAGVLDGAGDDIQLLESYEVDPEELLDAVKKLGFEGIVAKQKDSIYEPGNRSRAWLKYKINKGQEFVIGGYTPGNPFDAIIVGYYEDGKLFLPERCAMVSFRMSGGMSWPV